MKIRRDIVDYIYFGVFFIFMFMFLTGQFSSATGTSLVVIDNADPNSMFPTYFQGDLFVIQKDAPTDIEIGDVIVYENVSGSRIIHRVVDIYVEGENYFFRVKGDDPITNPTIDGYQNGTLIPFDVVLGEVVYRVPYLGHISLAMQQNIVVQIIIYTFAILITLAIVMWPTDEEEEEEYFDISSESFAKFKASTQQNIRNIIGIFTTSRYKILAWILLIMISLLTVMPFFIPYMVPVSNELERGVVDIRFGNQNLVVEQNQQYMVEFFNTFVTMFDDGNLVDHIEAYTMTVYSSNGTQIDQTKWNTLRPIIGEFTVGGTITIPVDIASNLVVNNDATITVEVVVHVDGFGGNYDLDPYSETLTLI